MDRTAYRKSKALTEAAKQIFGDIVECAYVEVPFVPENSPLAKKYKDVHEQYRERMFKSLANPDFQVIDNALHWDCLTFSIHFTNGNTVSFTNSEWSSMTKVNLKNELKYINV